MATAAVNLPIHGDGTCMKCRATPPDFETLTCRTCAAPWHVPCLSSPLDPDSNPLDWPCPDCDDVTGGGGFSVGGMGGDLIAKVRAIEADETLDEREKARMRQALVSGKAQNKDDEEEDDGEDAAAQDKKKGVLGLLLGGCLSCSICKELPERPVTTPCGHNFCLKCFQKLVRQERVPRCANCRTTIPPKIADQPRINSALVAVIRMSKSAKSANIGSSQVYHFTRNEVRPEKAFTTDRAKRAGKANACSGQIFVTVPPDHFGPITAENDPKTHRGVVVGDSWEDRLECRQWGAHLPHVAGIAGQSDHGAQSVALSGGYEDDEDHGEWFLYTGSGGRDLSGNKRTNKEQSSDQKFEKSNQALRVSCINGYPVRVVRSWKEKRSSYAPEGGVRYDGIYRIEKCWRKAGIQGKLVCRYLFVRCDNVPAPWTSDVHGDRPRPLPAIKELNGAVDVTDRNSSPSWDYDETNGWNWTKLPPVSKKPVRTGDANEQKMTKEAIVTAQRISVKEQLLKEFKCLICHKVMASPVSTPCGHNFCKMCLLGSYSDLSFVRERKSSGGRTLRAQKIVKKCPSCPTDICEFLQQPQVNRELMELIESIKHECEEEKKLHDKGEKCDGEGNSNENISDSADDNKFSEEAEEDLEDAKENIASKRGAANGTLHPKKRRKMGDAANADEDGNDSPSSPLNISVEDNGSE